MEEETARPNRFGGAYDQAMIVRTTLLIASAACLLQAPSLAQRGTSPVRMVPSAGPAGSGASMGASAPSQAGVDGPRPVILLTGYWPPTNEMIRHFASDPALNTNWLGSDWEGRGYDIHAYFPEFAQPNCSFCGKGNGWLEVDYQDTVADWATITNLHRPVAIITFSRGFNNTSWEVEMNQINRLNWIPDYQAPTLPTPSPPDSSIATNTVRPSVHPVQAIVDRVGASVPGVNPAICFTGNGGGFLSEFIAYLGVWYQDDHNDPADPDWCVAGGHVHVGGQIPWATARLAADETLRTVIDHVDSVLATTDQSRHCTANANSSGAASSLNLYGTQSITGELTRLMADNLPANQFGIFFYGQGMTQAPFGDGVLCIASNLNRIPIPNTTTIGGRVWMNLDFSAAPLVTGAGAITGGSTWSFQYWFRDPAAGGAGYNATDALELVFAN